MAVNDLASALHLDKSNASRITKSLERKNYVRRAPDGRDGRVLRVTATRPGRDLDTSIRDGIIARQQAVLSRFPPEVRRAAPRLLEELAANVMGRSN
jgi:DNA-binding MarR family transcriptional regulator